MPSSVINAKKYRKTIEWKRLDLFKKIRDTKGIFCAQVGTKMNRNDMNITEAEDIRNRWQEYTDKLYEKIFMTQITRMLWSFT